MLHRKSFPSSSLCCKNPCPMFPIFSLLNSDSLPTLSLPPKKGRCGLSSRTPWRCSDDNPLDGVMIPYFLLSYKAPHQLVQQLFSIKTCYSNDESMAISACLPHTFGCSAPLASSRVERW